MAQETLFTVHVFPEEWNQQKFAPLSVLAINGISLKKAEIDNGQGDWIEATSKCGQVQPPTAGLRWDDSSAPFTAVRVTLGHSRRWYEGESGLQRLSIGATVLGSLLVLLGTFMTARATVEAAVRKSDLERFIALADGAEIGCKESPDKVWCLATYTRELRATLDSQKLESLALEERTAGLAQRLEKVESGIWKIRYRSCSNEGLIRCIDELVADHAELATAAGCDANDKDMRNCIHEKLVAMKPRRRQ